MAPLSAVDVPVSAGFLRLTCFSNADAFDGGVECCRCCGFEICDIYWVHHGWCPVNYEQRCFLVKSEHPQSGKFRIFPGR